MKNKLASFYNQAYKGNRYNSKEAVDLFSYLDSVDKGNALDIGIGTGVNVKTLVDNGFKVTGIDISDYAIKQLSKQYPDCSFFTSDVLDFEIKKNNYSLIICSMMLHHLKESEVVRTIKKMKAGLKKGGLIFVSVLSDRDPTANRDHLPCDSYLDTIKSNLSLDRLQSFFKNFETIVANDLYFQDKSRTKKLLKYYGISIYVGRKH